MDQLAESKRVTADALANLSWPIGPIAMDEDLGPYILDGLVAYELGELKHNRCRDLPPVFLEFPDKGKFVIDLELHADNLRQPTITKLTIHIGGEDTDSSAFESHVTRLRSMGAFEDEG